MADAGAIMADAADVVALAAFNHVVCHEGVIMILVMALVLTIVRLLVAWVGAAPVPHVLAQLVLLVVLLWGATELWLVVAAAVAAVIMATVPVAEILAVVTRPTVVSTLPS